MKTGTLYIENPSKNLLNFVREMKANKEKNRHELLSKKDLYIEKNN